MMYDTSSVCVCNYPIEKVIEHILGSSGDLLKRVR